MRPAGKSAVMAERAPALVAADDARTALYRKLEYFPTPPWAARAGGELIAALDPHPGTGGESAWWAWEPACGEGHMAHGLADYFAKVHASDIHDHGWSGQHGPPLDFLSPHADQVDQIDWIATNPPFGKAAEFVEAGLRRARRGVAILARLALFESAGRYPLFFGSTPLTVLAPFFERVPMQLGLWDPRGSTATAYAWFVWMQPGAIADVSRRTRRLFPPAPLVMAIPPGTRERLTRPDDARLFGVKSPSPLFDQAADAPPPALNPEPLQ